MAQAALQLSLLSAVCLSLERVAPGVTLVFIFRVR